VGHDYRRIGTRTRARFQLLQALEDAIAYRRARVAAPCPDCGSAGAGRRCDEHACDLNLIAAYQRTARAAILGLHGPGRDTGRGQAARRHEAV